MGVGYSQYQNKTGILKDQLPENLARADFELDNGENCSQKIKNQQEKTVESIQEKIVDTKQVLNNLTGDLERIQRGIQKTKSIEASCKTTANDLEFLPIPRESTLDNNNKTLLKYNDSEQAEILLFDYKPLKVSAKSSLSDNNKSLLVFQETKE